MSMRLRASDLCVLSVVACSRAALPMGRRPWLVLLVLVFLPLLRAGAQVGAGGGIIVPVCPPAPGVQKDESTASFDVEIFGERTFHVEARGETSVQHGELDPGTGAVPIEIVGLSLVSSEPALTIRQSPTRKSRGEARKPHAEDIPIGREPVCVADSFFDVFVEIDAGNDIYENVEPIRMSGREPVPLVHKGRTFALFQTNDAVSIRSKTTQKIVGEISRTIHTINPVPPTPNPCFPGAGTDIMESTLLHDIDIPGVGLCRANLSGPVTVKRSDPYMDPATGLTCIDTEMVEMLLQGVDPVCGRISIVLSPFRSSRGKICEKVKGTCFPANSFFDVFVKVELKDLNLCLYSCVPARMECMISQIPPFGCLYNLNIGEGTGPIPLYRGPCDPPAGADPCSLQPLPPPAAYILKAIHQPLPPQECRCFPPAGEDVILTTLFHQIVLPGIDTACSEFTGAIVVRRGDPYVNEEGLCCIKTQVVRLEMRGKCANGATATIRLCPDMPSNGLICAKERGRCFPANSCFEIFFEIEVELDDTTSVTFKNCKPATMCCMIDALPPIGCPYTLQNAPIELHRVLAGGRSPCRLSPLPPPDGFLQQALHRPEEPGEPCCPEFGPGRDTLDTQLLHDIDIPGVGRCMANLSGPVVVERGSPYVDPATGLCCVETRMVSMDLRGFDPLCGRISITLDPRRPSKGQICSKARDQCFPANSCFEVFVRVELLDLGLVLVACDPARMCCMIEAIPPFGCLYQLEIGAGRTVPLYRELPGADVCSAEPRPNPSAFIVRAVHRPDPPCRCFPPRGDDVLQSELSHRVRLFGLGREGGDLICDADMSGPLTVRRSDPTFDPVTGLCCIDTEIVEMELRGIDPVCGPVIIRRCPDRPSRGQICQKRENPRDQCFPANSFFDVFVEIEVPNLNLTLKTCAPTRMECMIDAIPPYNCVYQLNLTDVLLYKPEECAALPNADIRPTGIIEAARHAPRLPCECPYGPGTDTMDSTLSHDIVVFGMEKLCAAPLRGVVEVERGMPYQSAEGLCCVSTRMTKLSLRGDDPVCGPVEIRLCPEQPSRGIICEKARGTCFPANSCFDVFVEVEVLGMVLKNCKPATMCCMINALPPFGCTYQLNLGEDVLLFKKGDCDNPTAVPLGEIRQAIHRPTPCGPVRLACEVQADGTVAVAAESDPACPCDGEIVITRSIDGGPEVVVGGIAAGAGAGAAATMDRPCDGLPPGDHVITYCARCVSAGGSISSEPVCCTVTVRCGDTPPDCIREGSARCSVVDGRVQIGWTHGEDCRCERVEVLFNGAPVASVEGAAGEITVSECAAGEYCVRCVHAGGMTGALHCCRVESCGGGGRQLPGDCNQDGRYDLSDGICKLGFLFLGQPARLPCGTLGANLAALDGDGSGNLTLTDAIRDFNYLFLGGPPPIQGLRCIVVEDCPDNPRCP